MGGEYEEFGQFGFVGMGFDVFQDMVVVVLVLYFWVDGEVGYFVYVFFGEGIQCSIVEDDIVVFNYGEVMDFLFDQFVVVFDQGVIGFQWFDQFQDVVDVFDGGLVQVFQVFVGDYGVYVIVGEQFQQC